jgi:hypothetical protein
MFLRPGQQTKSPPRLNDELKSNYRYNMKGYEEDYNMENLGFVDDMKENKVVD